MDNLPFHEKIGFVIENKEGVIEIVKILAESDSVKKKKEAVKLLSSLIRQPEGGRTRVLECFTVWKERTKSRFRYQPLVRELDSCRDSDYAYQLLSLINSLIATCENAEERLRMRNEFLGLKLHSTFDKLKALPSNSNNNSELMKQLDTFDEMKTVDEDHMNGSDDVVDLNSHVDIFYAILKQVSQSPHEILFLNILQHLLQIDSRDYVWETTEKLACRAKLLESKEEAEKLLRLHTGSAMMEKLHGDSRCNCLCHGNAENSNNEEKLAETKSKCSKFNETGPPTPPPLPPPLLLRKINNRTSPTKETNFAELISKAAKINNASHKFAGGDMVNAVDAPIPACQFSTENAPISNITEANKQLQINQLNVGLRPKQKLRTFAWNKVPIAKVVSNRDNIWIKAANNFTGDFSLDVDVLEELFCQSSPPNTLERKVSSPNVVSERKKRDSNEINLLDPKRSLNINIFLRQFRGDVKDLTELIESVNGAKIGLEKLRSLTKIMPELDEIESLTSYTEDKSKLGSAEKFFMVLINIPHYRLRVESMLLKEEFSTLVDYIKPSVNIVLLAAKDLKNNSALHDVMYLVLMVGNYLNSGSYGGNAVGFKMTSLWKLVEIRANKPNVTLLHFVVMEVEKKNSSLLEFSKQMKYLEEVSKLPIETIASDFRTLKEKTARISKCLEHAECTQLTERMNDFLEYAKQELVSIDKQMREMEKLRLDLSLFFCEDPQTFKLEDCFKIFYNFCLQFNKAIEENNERKVREEKSEIRKKQLKEQQKSKAKDSIIAAIRRTNVIENDEMKAKNDLSSMNIAQDVTLLFEKQESTLNSSNIFNVSSKFDQLSKTPLVISSGRSMIEENKTFRRTTSRRRFTTALNDVMSTNDRERPVKPWRERLDELLKKEEQTFDISNTDVSKTAHQRRSLDLTNAPTQQAPKESSSSSSFTECSPIFAKPFVPCKIEFARISSISDLRRHTLANETDKRDHRLRRDFEYSNKSQWRLERGRRSQSLHVSLDNHNSNRGDCANDLTELLRTLETEKKLNEIGKQRSRRINVNGFATDGDVGDYNTWKKRLLNGKQSDSNLNLHKSCESVNKKDDDSGTLVLQQNSSSSKVLDDKSVPLMMDLTDNKMIIKSSNYRIDETKATCSNFSHLTLSQDDPPSNFKSNAERPNSFKPRAKLNVWPSPHSYSDQSDARSTESPTESVGERDEGFETESHSTACSEQNPQLSPNLELSPVQSPPISDLIANEAVSKIKPDGSFHILKAKQQCTPGFMLVTKASQSKNSLVKPQPAQLTVKSAIGASGNFVKRMIESISSKKPVRTVPIKHDPSPNHVQLTVSMAPTSKPKPVTTVRNHSTRASNAACASHSSSSSLSASPVRKPSASHVNPRKVKPVEKQAVQKLSTPTMTPATKQRITHMRSRLKASKETTSSSDSDKGPPPRRIPPRTMKSLAAKSSSSAIGDNERKLSVPDKTWQRLMSPPKTMKTFSDTEQQRNRAQSLSSGSNYTTAQNTRSSAGNDKSPSSASVIKKKIWR